MARTSHMSFSTATRPFGGVTPRYIYMEQPAAPYPINERPFCTGHPETYSRLSQLEAWQLSGPPYIVAVYTQGARLNVQGARLSV
jgi:hypothetical protein